VAGPEVESDGLRAGSRPPSDELRASLAAVQAARQAAQDRLRRDTRQVRVVSILFLVTFAASALAVVGHYRSRRRTAGHAPPAAAVTTPAAAALAVVPGPSAPGAVSAHAVRGPDAVSGPGATTTAAATADFAAALATCNEAYEDHVWPIATDACARAAELRPRDPALAMKVAQAFHARGRYADAGGWARRALALDGVDPEALVILAHAERRAGHAGAARTAYRRYLVLAPRGWHAAEARAAVRPAGEQRAHVRARNESAEASAPAVPYAASLESNADR
jgi:cytochrome c-type biogenesis protein CcmH/NrfG